MLTRIFGSTDGGATWKPLAVDADGHAQADVLSLPALPAGTNNIGDVDVLTLPTSKNLGLFSSISTQKKSNLNASAGNNYLESDAVSASTVLVVTHMTMVNSNSGITSCSFDLIFGGSTYNVINSNGALAANYHLAWSGKIYIPATGKLRATWIGCTLNDNLHFTLLGYVITA